MSGDGAMLRCPLPGCPWQQDREASRFAESNHAAAPAVAAALGLPTEALLGIHAGQAMLRDEETLRRHLSMHGPGDWLPALMDARGRLDELLGHLGSVWPGQDPEAALRAAAVAGSDR